MNEMRKTDLSFGFYKEIKARFGLKEKKYGPRNSTSNRTLLCLAQKQSHTEKYENYELNQIKGLLRELYSYPNGKQGFIEFYRIISNMESIFILSLLQGVGCLIKPDSKKKFNEFFSKLLKDNLKCFHFKER